MKIVDLFWEQYNTYNSYNQKGGVQHLVGKYLSVPEKLIEQYEKRLHEKDEVIALLKKRGITLTFPPAF